MLEFRRLMREMTDAWWDINSTLRTEMDIKFRNLLRDQRPNMLRRKASLTGVLKRVVSHIDKVVAAATPVVEAPNKGNQRLEQIAVVDALRMAAGTQQGEARPKKRHGLRHVPRLFE